MPGAGLACVELVEMTTDWMDGALDDDARTVVEQHLAICPNCTDYVAQLRRSIEVLGRAPGEAPPADARAALLDAFRHRDVR